MFEEESRKGDKAADFVEALAYRCAPIANTSPLVPLTLSLRRPFLTSLLLLLLLLLPFPPAVRSSS